MNSTQMKEVMNDPDQFLKTLDQISKTPTGSVYQKKYVASLQR